MLKSNFVFELLKPDSYLLILQTIVYASLSNTKASLGDETCKMHKQ